jgi:hypothetical protein
MALHKLLKDDYVLPNAKKGAKVEVPDELVPLLVKNGAIADPKTGKQAEAQAATTDAATIEQQRVELLQKQLDLLTRQNEILLGRLGGSEGSDTTDEGKRTGPMGVAKATLQDDAASNSSASTTPTKAEAETAKKAAKGKNTDDTGSADASSNSTPGGTAPSAGQEK